MTLTYHAGRRIQGTSNDKSGINNVTWNNATANDVIISGNTITETSSGDWGHSRAKTTQSCPVGTYMKLSYSPISGGAGFVGFDATSTPDSVITSHSYMIYTDFGNQNEWRVHENNSYPYVGGSWTTADSFQVEINTNGTVKYYKNNVLAHTSSIQMTEEMWIQFQGVGAFRVSPTYEQPPNLSLYQTQSRFEETDTQTMYYLQPDLTIINNDDFTSYANQGAVDAVYIPMDNTKIAGDTVNDRLNYQAVADNTNDSLSRDLGTISDTKWILRFRFSMTAQSRNGSGYEMYPVIGISDSDHNTPEASAQKGIAFVPYQDNVIRPYHITYGNGNDLGGDIGSGNTRVTAFTEIATAGDNYFIELKRTSATSATASIYSDSAYTTLVESKTLTVPSSITGLRYFVVKNAAHTQNQSGSQTGWIDDISFWNDVTTPISGKYWSAQQ